MSKKPNDNLYKFSVETPWQFVFVVILYLIGAVSVPPDLFTFIFGNSMVGQFISMFFVKALCCILPFWLIKEIKCTKILKGENLFKGLVILIPFLLVVINNFPFVAIFEGEATFKENLTFLHWFSYVLAVFGGVVLEEVTFRGLVFTTLLRKFKDNKRGDFLAVLISSSLFGIVHIVNLLAGASIGSVILQIGYSLLIGGMCSIAFLKTGNFYHTILLHFIFNNGGLLITHNMISGNIWTMWEIIVTAVLAVIVTIYALYILLIKRDEKLSDKLAVQLNTDDIEVNDKTIMENDINNIEK